MFAEMNLEQGIYILVDYDSLQVNIVHFASNLIESFIKEEEWPLSNTDVVFSSVFNEMSDLTKIRNFCSQSASDCFQS